MNREQVRAILWLRWRLTRNQFARGGRLNAVLSFVALAAALLGSAGLAVGAVVLGFFLGSRAPGDVLMLVWDGVLCLFLVFWLTGLMVEIQRSESIDLTKLLHLPVRLQQVFVFNFLASHLTISIVVLVPAMMGLCLGLALGSGPLMILLLPLVLGVLFAITAWTYCLRGWLAGLMVNKRKRRAILVWITIALVLLGQIPNLVFNSRFFRNQHGPRHPPTASGRPTQFRLPASLVNAHLAVPPAWAGYGAMELKRQHPFPALGFAAASWLIAGLGLMRAYRLTIRFYQGAEETARKIRARVSGETPSQRPLLVERRLPWMTDELGALTLANFRSLSRAPELKMMLLMPVIFGVLLPVLFFRGSGGNLSSMFASFAVSGAVFFAAFTTAQTMANAFGLDRNGFRTLVLLPTSRRDILLAKNLAFLPFTSLVALVFLVVVGFLARPPWMALVTGLVQIPTAFLLFSLLTNFSSILVPFRVAPGTLKAAKPRAVVIVAVFANLLLMPLILTPLLVPAGLQLLGNSLGWVPWLPVNLLAALVILAFAAGAYWGILPLQGRLLQKREQTILREVTEEVE